MPSPWEVEQAQKYETLRTLVERIARCLSSTSFGCGTWHTIKDGNTHVKLSNDTGMTSDKGLRFSISNSDSTKGRLRVAGIYAVDKFGQSHIRTEDRVSITVAADRDPIDIAKDIHRRFLPLHKVAEEKAVALAKEHDDYIANRDANVMRLAKAFNVQPSNMSEAGREPSVSFYQTGRFSGSCRVYQNSVNFDRMSLPIDVAVKVAELIQKAMAEAQKNGDTE